MNIECTMKLSETTLVELDNVQTKLASSRADAVARSIRFASLVINDMEKGARILAEMPDGSVFELHIK